jgi:anti-sigma factor RsiW
MNQPPAEGSRPYITCREVLDFIMAYLDGELSTEQRHEFDRHLGVCPSCVNYLETYKATILLGKRAMCEDEPAASGDIPESLIQAVRAARLRGA